MPLYEVIEAPVKLPIVGKRIAPLLGEVQQPPTEQPKSLDQVASLMRPLPPFSIGAEVYQGYRIYAPDTVEVAIVQGQRIIPLGREVVRRENVNQMPLGGAIYYVRHPWQARLMNVLHKPLQAIFGGRDR